MSSYNGWSNYETWRVNLEMLDGITLGDFGFNAADLDPDSLMDYEKVGQAMEMYVCEMVEQDAKGFALDLAHNFLAKVEWDEIAEHMIRDVYAEMV